MNERRTTNILLLMLVIPLVFYLLKTLSFIFVPLISAMFITLLFLPLMRWLKKRGIPKIINIFIVIVIIAVFFKIAGELIQLSSREILAPDNLFFDKAKVKMADLFRSLEAFFGVTFIQGENSVQSFINKETLLKNIVPTVDFISSTVSKTLTTVFLVLLLLAGSVDIQKLLNSLILKKEFSSIKTFMKIEKDLVTFIKVKFFISLATGIGIGIACWSFGVSFPIFWGLFAFAINFLQLIGSVITVIGVSIFAFVEIETLSILFFFILTSIGVQVLFGAILEPIFMGKSFSINVITILIMLMLWGYIWGIPGLIMSIPITVFLKILFDQFPRTRLISQLMQGNTAPVSVRLPTLLQEQKKD